MKYIEKNLKIEPRALKEHRSMPRADYDSFNDKDPITEDDRTRMLGMMPVERELYVDAKDKPLKKAILKEQGYICCYCMRRIELRTMAVEHFITQRRHEKSPFSEEEHFSNQLKYSNLIGACRSEFRDCSGLRSNTPLVVDPRKKEVEELVGFKKSGFAYSDFELIDYDLNQTLRLNPRFRADGSIDESDEAFPLFKNRREAIFTAKKRLLAHYGDEENATKAVLRREIEYWKAPVNGRYREYCMAAVHYLQSKLIHAQ